MKTNKTNFKLEIVETEDLRVGIDISAQLRNQMQIEMSGSLEHRLALVAYYIKAVQTIETLGWLEHTADWDLSTTVILVGGETIHSETGYPGLTVLGFNIEKDCIIDEILDYEVELETEVESDGHICKTVQTRRFKLSEIERIILVD